ncbi:MAG: Fic family protein [Parcubacteria group bacterium]|nr:Fic family protein [Parcubacteria group bacterium]
MELGRYIQQKSKQWSLYKAFVPHSFPPKEGFDIPQSIIKQDAQAQHLVSKLDGVTQLLPDVDFFLFMYILKDAASSSQIEGTGATMIDALEAEAEIGSNLPEDVDDITHYIKALNSGISTLKKIPISIRLIKQLHKDLMEDARHTQNSYPGEFRHDQNWINGTNPRDAKFVPPPPHELLRVIGDWETFAHTEDTLLPLTKAALLHAQFETIHPFRDGNGRTGRMLTTLYLREIGLLEKPVLFLSAYFKKHQQMYYDRLHGYGNSEVHEWVKFFLLGVSEIASEAIDTVHKITKLRERDILRIQSMDKRSSMSAVAVLPKLFSLPIVDVSTVQKWTGFTRNGSQKLVDRFVDLNILYLRDTKKKYNKSYIYKDYVDIFYDTHKKD